MNATVTKTFLLLLVVMIVACTERTIPRAGSQLATLRGRCITLTASVKLVPTGDDGLVDSFVLSHGDTAGSTELLPGTELLIVDVVLQSKFETRHAVIVGHIKGGAARSRISLFSLFDPEWLARAEADAFDDDAEHRKEEPANVLRYEAARWCD